MTRTLAPRFAALALAVSVTLAMLTGIGALAEGQAAHAQLAAIAAAPQG